MVKVLVEGKNLDVTGALKKHARQQSQKITKLNKTIVAIRIFLETVGRKTNDPLANQVTYEINVPGKDVVVRTHAADMYEAITKAADAAARKLRKAFEKKVDLSRKLDKTQLVEA